MARQKLDKEVWIAISKTRKWIEEVGKKDSQEG